MLPVAIATSSAVDRPMIARLAGLNVPTNGRAAHVSGIDGTAQPHEVMSGGASFVTVVQAADFPEGDHVTLGDALHASRRWRVFRQREMRSCP